MTTRIFCVITQGELGGAQQFVAQLAKNLDPERFTLHVVWGADSSGALARLLPPHVTFATARHLVRRPSFTNDIRSIYELRRAMRAFRPDVVLCISSKAGFNGALAARPLRKQFPGLKVIYRIGGWQFNDPRPAWERSAYMLLERFSARWKDTIVVNNTHDLQQARQLGIRPRHRVVRIYNGIDPYTPFLPREQARAYVDNRMASMARSGGYAHLVGTIANLYPAKDIPLLVRVAARMPSSIRFVVMGEGAERAAIERCIRECGLSERFLLLGSVRDAWKYLPALDVFALPSLKEGFPWALLEAMAAKVPVIATRVGAVPEMLENGVSGIICEPGNVQQFVDGIARILGSEELRQSLTINAHQQVLTKFSLRDMLAQYERLFTE